MSTVFLQVGQCGNQIGQSLWKKIAKDEDVLQSHSFIANDGRYRAVLVDSEPKVIHKVTRGLPFRQKSIVTGKRGRGTNWALGYHGLQHLGDDHLLESTVDAVRAEVERCDRFNGIILLHSLSGGTGSGLGSHLVETLRDEYTAHHLMSCVFAPCASGESPLQHYNSLLTLAALQRNTDCIMLTHNDDVLCRVQKNKGSTGVSFSQLNDVIASQLCGLFLPTDTLKTKCGFRLGMEPWEMLRSVSPMPNLKFIQLSQLNKSKDNWSEIVGQLVASLRRYDSVGKPFASLGNLVVARGDSSCSFLRYQDKVGAKVKQAYNSVSWNPFPTDYWTAAANYPGTKNSAGVTIATNSSSVVEYLDNVLERSKVMYDAGAYLHWYWRHGASKENFEEAFEDVQKVVDDYTEAVKPS